MSARDTLTVPATMAGVRQAADTASAWTDRLMVPLEVRRRALTTLDEVLSNIVHHGVRGGPGVIQMTLAYEAGALEIELTDDANPFNLCSFRPPTSARRSRIGYPGDWGLRWFGRLRTRCSTSGDAKRNRVTMRFDAHRGTRDV